MKVQLPKSRGHSITVIGALSIQRGHILTNVFTGSNNTGTFSQFILQLKEICAGTKTVVVMDNLSVHHANDVVKLFDENHFVAKFLPTYSCDLNPIEKVWHLLKQQWRRTAHLRLDYGKKEDAIMRDAEDSIRHLCTEFDKDLMLKIAKSNYEAMEKSL